MLPNIASWAQNQIDGALAAAGTSGRRRSGWTSSPGNGVIYHGLQLFGGGGTLTGLMLGCDRRVHHRPPVRPGRHVCAAAAVLAFFGFINGTALGFGNSAPIALGYLLMGGLCLVVSRAHEPLVDRLVIEAEVTE